MAASGFFKHLVCLHGELRGIREKLKIAVKREIRREKFATVRSGYKILSLGRNICGSLILGNTGCPYPALAQEF